MLGDTNSEKEFVNEYIYGTYDLEFIRNEGKNSIKYYGKQEPRLRHFIPFGSDIFILEQDKHLVVVYTRKDAPISEITIFYGRNFREYIPYLKYKQEK